MLSADRIHSFGDSSAGSAVRAYTKSRSSIRISTANSVLITREQSCPVHIAGSARRLARSLMQRRRRLISCVVCSVSMFTSLAYDLRPKCSASGFGPFPQVSQEFVGRHKKRILLEDSTNVDGLLAAFEPVLYERQEHAILVIMTVEKTADMRSADHCVTEPNRTAALRQNIPG